MKLSYKSVYHLLERYFARQTFLDQFIDKDIPPSIFQASLLFAEKSEDYDYLTVMRDKELYSGKYVFFTNMKQEHPIILEKNKNLTIIEFAFLYLQCDIHIQEFKDTLEAQAENIQESAKTQIEIFEDLVNALQKLKEKVE